MEPIAKDEVKAENDFNALLTKPNPAKLGPFEPKSWAEFLDKEKQFPLRHPWICRGLSDSVFQPSSALQRNFDEFSLNSCEARHQIEADGIKFFQDKAGKLNMPEPYPAEDDLLGWLALMQHYGAPTRLIGR